jgi:hypothetical protein
VIITPYYTRTGKMQIRNGGRDKEYQCRAESQKERNAGKNAEEAELR